MPESLTALVVDDEANIRSFLKLGLESAGFSVYAAGTVSEALKVVDNHAIDLVITDYRLPDQNGLELIRSIRSQADPPYVIMITAYGDVDLAVEAMKHGAFDFLNKPFEMDDIIGKIQPVAEIIQARRRQLDRMHTLAVDRTMVGRSEPMQHIRNLIQRVALTPTTVLITGETGTGKELVAKAIHDASERQAYPFIAINCTAITEQLLESELFGYEKGAFTDARSQKKGLFEVADKGTLFFDEIGDMAEALQAKLLRVLQDQKIRRIGGVSDIDVDVRIISATHRELSDLVRERRFREDLYFRLNVFPIDVPPLRERGDDIVDIANHCIREFATAFNKPAPVLTKDAEQAIQRYSWPGNVREMRNVFERILILHDDERLRAVDLPVFIQPSTDVSRISAFKEAKQTAIERFELEYVTELLAKVQGNVTKAAEIAQMDRTVLQRLINKLGLKSADFK